ncbi:MAG: 5-methyltetrahydropteroyltriglutamate--homocysteine S-methyltransferase [Bryobacteraceae bacterium]
MGIVTGNLGFPRIGARRELKFALEKYWSGQGSAQQLQTAAQELRKNHWRMQADAGIEQIPSNDFSLYDHVLDTAALIGAVPARYDFKADRLDIETYFAMARGTATVPAMEMTKWFDTNYHYLVPEFETGMELRTSSQKPVDEFREAKALGLTTRPVLLGPVSFVLLGKIRRAGFHASDVAEAVVDVYGQVLKGLASEGAIWIQIDEPCLGLDLSPSDCTLYRRVYERLASLAGGLKILIAAYFSDLRENLDLALNLPVAGLHLDLVRAPGQLAGALQHAPAGLTLSLGVVDGRGIWRTDLDHALRVVRSAVDRLGHERVQIAPSCSLLHVPADLDQEMHLDNELRSWLAFAKQKLDEVRLLARAIEKGSPEVREQFEESRRVLADRREAPRICDPAVRARVAAIAPPMLQRHASYTERRKQQERTTPLPVLPTTTIGSFPQTPEVRRMRAEHRSGKISAAEYESFLRAEVERTIRFEEETGLDVLVHGEFERNDMVEYFGEQLNGFAFTRNGWVQSYGSRCVKPPVLFGDVSRPHPMTVAWARYAQSLTTLPVKAMLTGPVTMLEWSFVRNDLPRAETCFQIALALREEVADLETAGVRVIQVDEPALREGLPLRTSDRKEYLRWSVDAFRLATAVVKDETQIHTHMCYAEFGEILDAIRDMDADVISMEAARSQMELLEAFRSNGYRNDIGPGVYDIHSPRIPTEEEMERLIQKALKVFRPDQVWVNPDCGLKTRRWEEVRASLANMVSAARKLRGELTTSVEKSR